MFAVEAYSLCCEWNTGSVICRIAMGFFDTLFGAIQRLYNTREINIVEC